MTFYRDFSNGKTFGIFFCTIPKKLTNYDWWNYWRFFFCNADPQNQNCNWFAGDVVTKFTKIKQPLETCHVPRSLKQKRIVYFLSCNCSFILLSITPNSIGIGIMYILESLGWLGSEQVKVASFQKVRFVFQISKSPKKIIPHHYPELEIWISCLLLWAGISNFKFMIVIWNIFFGDLEIWKTNHTFWKKPPLVVL